jgi:hypothetical protein
MGAPHREMAACEGELAEISTTTVRMIRLRRAGKYQ